MSALRTGSDSGKVVGVRPCRDAGPNEQQAEPAARQQIGRLQKEWHLIHLLGGPCEDVMFALKQGDCANFPAARKLDPSRGLLPDKPVLLLFQQAERPHRAP